MLIIVDGGREFQSNKLLNLCYALGIRIQISITEEPCHKETIERLYKLVNEKGINGITVSDIAAIDSEGDIKWD